MIKILPALISTAIYFPTDTAYPSRSFPGSSYNIKQRTEEHLNETRNHSNKAGFVYAAPGLLHMQCIPFMVNGKRNTEGHFRHFICVPI